MKNTWKFIGYSFLAILVLIYLAFIFVLPRCVNLNEYKPLVQQLAKEQAHLNIDFDNAKIITTPLLEAGIVLDNLKVSLLDDSELVDIDRAKVKLSLPNLLILTVRISEISIDNPKINIEINEEGSQYKVMQVVEDLINEQKQKQEVVQEEKSKFQFNPNWIKIKVPNVKCSNYLVLINDLSTKHDLKLRGEELPVSYYDKKNVKFKTNAELLSDDNLNVNANVKIDTFLPKPVAVDKEDDPDYRTVLGFVNPVLLYRDFDLKTNIDVDLKARMSLLGNLKVKGYANIDDLTATFSGYKIPKSYIKTYFKGQKVHVNTNLYLTQNQNIILGGLFYYSKRPKMMFWVSSAKIYFKDLITMSKALMDTLKIKNDLANVNASGYFASNMFIKTNFKKIKGDGGFVIRDGSLINNSLGLSHINANVIFRDKKLEILDTFLNVNDAILKIDGSINEKHYADISIYTDKLPLAPLFKAFAPVEVKRSINIKSGILALDTKIQGKLKEIVGKLYLTLSDLELLTADNSIVLKNQNLSLDMNCDLKSISGKILNKNLSAYITATKSLITNPETEIIIDKENIIINPLKLFINKVSEIDVEGSVLKYTKKALLNMDIKGVLNSADLKQFMGDIAVPFVDAKGALPFKLAINGDAKRQKLRLQLKTNAENYLTPIHVEMLSGKPNILQAIIHFKGDRLNIRDTGLYAAATDEFGDDFELNLEGASQLSSIRGTISKLNTSDPYINQMKVTLPKEVKAKIHAFPKSTLKYGGDLMIFGYSSAPKFKGDFILWDLSIPELLISLRNLDLNFVSRTLNINLEDLLLNGSDIQVKSALSLAPSPILVINNLDIASKLIDLNKIMSVSDRAMKYVPKTSTTSSKTNSNSNENIPIQIEKGTIDLKRISVPPLLLLNTVGNISLNENIFYLNNLYTSTLGGSVRGDVSINLVTLLLRAKLSGQNFDIERSLLELLNMKDALSGIASFDTDIAFDAGATNLNDQMKSLKGYVNFNAKKGQFGPFGRLENMILSENIRESQFFQTALGGVIDSLTSIQTSHYDVLNGRIELSDGIVSIVPITSLGPVMCLYVAGDLNLLENQADMVLRARLGSKIADMLGPIAAVNPINLLKVTPGMNVAAAKMFALFCEEITSEEMDMVPKFDEKFNTMSATNFQIVLAGDVAKPLTLFKSFKWLATAAEISAAQSFVETLPPIDENNPNATIEELIAMQEEAERIANENILQKSIRKTKEFFTKQNKEDKE